mgnify:CR=1 FL=1
MKKELLEILKGYVELIEKNINMSDEEVGNLIESLEDDLSCLERN